MSINYIINIVYGINNMIAKYMPSLKKRKSEKGDRLLFMTFCPRVETLLFLREKVASPFFFGPIFLDILRGVV
jgi:hypothetical protein